MSPSPMLQDKHAVVFGAGGSIGAVVAKELASEGAEVFLAGRTSTGVEATAKEITAAGGRAHAAVIDALDGPAVDAYVEAVVKQAGSLDIEFNATGPRISEYGNGKRAVDLTAEEFIYRRRQRAAVPVHHRRGCRSADAQTRLRRDHLPDREPGATARPRGVRHWRGLRRCGEPHADDRNRTRSLRSQSRLPPDRRAP